MNNITLFDDEITQRLFGHEAAEDEDPKRLRAYYFKSGIFERATANLPLRILVGHKGLGKSAMFQVARQQDADNSILAVFLRPDDVHEIETVTNLLAAIRSWKEGLLRIIYNKCLNMIGKDKDADSSWWNKGYKLVDLLLSVVANQNKGVDAGKKKLAEALLAKKLIRVYIDDLDRGWSPSKANISRLSSLLNATRDLVNEHPGLQFRIALRSDVYYLVRTADESTDKIEGSVVWLSWTNHEILAMLVKRVQSYLGHELQEAKLVSMQQPVLAAMLNPVIEPRYQGYGQWDNIPTYRMLMSLTRRRPRDLVKLCSLAAHATFERKGSKIDSADFTSIFTEYSQGRFQDAVNEYRSELPTLENLLLAMRPSSEQLAIGKPFLYTPSELLSKLSEAIASTQHRFYGGRVATESDLAAFLFKMNFLTARNQERGKIIRQYFEDNRYLSSSFEHPEFDWEVHPAYRWTLRAGRNEEIIAGLDEYEDV